MRRVLRWDVQINDNVQKIGGSRRGPPCRRREPPPGPTRRLEVWTEEEILTDMTLGESSSLLTRLVVVIGTAHRVPEGFEHIGSVLDPDPGVRLVWHVYEQQPNNLTHPDESADCDHEWVRYESSHPFTGSIAAEKCARCGEERPADA